MWLPYLTLFLSAIVIECENISSAEEEIKAMLQDAVTDVLAQHSDEMSKPDLPPFFSMPSDFMHSFVPGTGAGNREELAIEAVRGIHVYDEETSSKYLYKRFNNTNYIASVSSKDVVLHKIGDSLEEYFVLSRDDSVFTFRDESSTVKDVVLFTEYVKYSEILYVAILTENSRTAVIYTYEIIHNMGVVVAAIDLKQKPNSVKKIAYVQSSDKGSLVVLSDAQTDPSVVHKQQGSRDFYSYIQVFYPSATDLITFTVHGRGYIAVSNQKTCDIFKLTDSARSHILFHSIGPLQGIVNIDYFRLGFHHYLAVVDSTSQYLYTWKSGEFSLKQKLNVANAIQIHPSAVESCRDEVLLQMVKTDGTLIIHAYDGQMDEFVDTNAVIPPDHLVQPHSMTSFPYKNKIVMIFVSVKGIPQALIIETSALLTEDPVLKEGQKVAESMRKIQDMLDSQNEEIKHIKSTLANAVRSNGNQVISGVQYFGHISATNGTIAEKINEVVLEWEDSNLTLEEYRHGVAHLEKSVEELEHFVQEIEHLITDVVRRDENSIITGQKIFKGTVFAETLMAESLNLEKVAGMSLKEIQESIYRLDRPQLIEGTLTFNEPLTVNANLNAETINGIHISKEVMTTDTEQISHAQMHFVNDLEIKGDLDISGKVNLIDISEEVVTLNGVHNITGPKNFLNGIKAENLETKLLDGVNISDLYERAFTKSGKQTILADATFSDVETSSINLKGTLNGYDLKELVENIVRIDQPSIITGFKTFTKKVIIDGELFIGGMLNGLRIPDDLFLTDKVQNVTGTKVFLGNVKAANVTVRGKIDGIKIPDDIITLSGDEEISSTLYFVDGISALKDIIVEGTVDGVKISEVAKQAMTLDHSNEFKKAVFLGPVKITGNLDVKGLVNNMNLTELVKDIVFKDDHPIEINSKKIFKEVIADKVILDYYINGHNINVDFMKVDGDQTVKGRKTFKQPVVFDSVQIADGKIGDLDIAKLYEEKMNLALQKESEVDNDIEFVDKVTVENLIVRGTVNGLRIPEDVVLKNSTQPISNKHFSSPVKVDNLIIDGDLNTEFFGGVNLTQFYNDRISLSGSQTIYGDIWIGNSTAAKVTISGLVNGIDIKEFASNVMSKTKEQTVIAAKEFHGNVSAYGFITTNGVNGFNLLDIKNRAFKLNEDNVVTAPVEFDDVTMNTLTVNEDINGVNIERLAKDSLKKTGVQYITGSTTFNAGFHVIGDIHADQINEMVLLEDVLLKSPPQTITGQFTFSNMAVGGDLTVDGLINGVDLSDLENKIARIDEHVVIESNILFKKPIAVTNDIVVSGTVNGLYLKDLYNSILRKSGDQFINGKKVFKGNVTIEGDLDVIYVNGVKWKEFLNDIVWINKHQVVNSHKTFIKDIIADDVFVSEDIHVGLINGKNLEQFVENAVFIDVPTNITGPIVFKNSVEVTGNMNADLINGLHLKTDVITIMCDDEGPQIITGQKTFHKVKMFSDIYTDRVNNYDLQKLYEDTLLTSEVDQEIIGLKTVHGNVIFKKDVLSDTVNGIIPQKDLVTLNTDQVIKGPMTFLDDVFVGKNMFIKGLLNGVDIETLSKEAVYLDSNQVIQGSYTFENVITTSNVEVNGTVNGIDFQDFDKNVTEFLDEANNSIAIMDRFSQDHCDIIKYLQETLENSYYALDSFAIQQKFDLPASFIQMKSENEVNLVYLDNTASVATAVLNVWNAREKTFSPVNFANTSFAKVLKYQIGQTNVLINIGINNKDSSVLVQNKVSSIPSGFSDACAVRRTQDLVIALLFPTLGICKTYIITEDLKDFQPLELNVGKKAKSLVMFELSNILYMAVSVHHPHPYIGGSSKIYARIDDNWQRVQQIPAHSSSLVEHFTYQGYHYLIFVNNAPVFETKEPKSIQIYRNSGPNDLMFSLFQKVPFDDAIGVQTFKFGDLSQLHLVAWNETRIQVFGLEGESGMKELFTIHGKCVKDVKPLFIAKEFYLLVAQQNLKTEEKVNSVLYKGLTKGVWYEKYNLTYC